MSSVLTVQWCTECRSDQVFEVPPCEDGHGADCLDLACTACGLAVVVGVVHLEVSSAAVHVVASAA